ncbi:MDS1 and EVI1 complex locus protein EVI1 [Orchesella cincta]|uniref:MDS1 and EVI1 complex locus protein EVI1 n=1 Tax=Orchesella cincta TaxID=48709 RepID=A0A1D2M6L6_ORCCI|nr:MDS1 and EVI1 complex locus protein EVI1 [Orchesella cincta]
MGTENYCLLCGVTTIPTEIEETNTDRLLNDPSFNTAFQCFLKRFDITYPPWFEKAFEFCSDCSRQLTALSQLDELVKKVQNRIKEGEKVVKNRFKSSESKFQSSGIYRRDRRYWRVRSQFLKKNGKQTKAPGEASVTEKPQPGEMKSVEDEQFSKATIPEVEKKSGDESLTASIPAAVAPSTFVLVKVEVAPEDVKEPEEFASMLNQKAKEEAPRWVTPDKTENIHFGVNLLRIGESHQYQCSACQAIFPVKNRYQEKSLMHHLIKQHTDIFKCGACEERFGFNSALQKHIETVHEILTPNKEYHKRFHLNVKPHQCSKFSMGNVKGSDLRQYPDSS